MMPEILIFGAGGHARAASTVLLEPNSHFSNSTYGFVIRSLDEPGSDAILDEKKILEKEFTKAPSLFCFIGIGDNFRRHQLVEKISKTHSQIEFIRLISQYATVASDVQIGQGTLVMPGAVINSGARIGDHCIVNTGAVIDHDCELADFVSIGPGSCLGGNSQVGRLSVIALGANIIHGVNIGDHVVLGAGSLATRNLPHGAVYYGVPARRIRDFKPGDTYL